MASTSNNQMRKSAPAQSTDSATYEKAQHYMNIEIDGVQIGYMVLDKQPKIVAKAQADSDYLNRMLKQPTVTASYREAGVSNKTEPNLDF